jgi:sRNA-binding regulator protein Hfq
MMETKQRNEKNAGNTGKLEKPKRYETGQETIDNFGKQQIGKSVIITMRNGRSESGILRGYGQYDIALELPTKRILIVMKHAIDTVSVL